MIIEDAFEIAAPIDAVWKLLNDVPRVTTCIPNAKLDETVDDRTYRATVTVKVGPVSVGYKTTIVIEEIDDASHRARLSVKGGETKGRGGVTAQVTSVAEALDETRTRVTLHTDASVSGTVATVGGRLIEGVAKKTTAQFAQNMTALLAGNPV